MFRSMRRKNQEIPREEALHILKEGSHGVLALSGDDGYPYALPISYVYDDGRIIFHSALAGHKIDAIRGSDKASFCVVASDDVVPLEYTTKYRSVIVFGRVTIVEDEERRYQDIMKLSLKYAYDDTEEHRKNVIGKSWNSFSIIELEIEHITGKESSTLSRERDSSRR